MTTDLIARCRTELAEDFLAIQDPTPEYSMRHFVVGQHDTPGQRWAQTVLELQNRLTALAGAEIDREICRLRIVALEKRGTPIALLKAKKKRLELTQLQWAELGTRRGVEHLLKIRSELEAAHDGRGWTREELDAEQPEYWSLRGQRQALQDVNAHGAVQVGNQDMLRMMGRPIDPPQRRVEAVERRFLETGKARVLVAVPTLIDRGTIREHGLQCLKGWELPGTFEMQIYVVQGKPIADAYNDAARKALEDGADFVLCVEDDHVIPAATFKKLWDVHQAAGPRSIVGAWYPQRKEPRTGSPIIVTDARRGYLPDDGAVHQVYGIPQGFTLIPTAIFRELLQPWFVTTSCLTQDSYFSQAAREAGYKLLVDTSARIKHVDRDTGRIYE